MNRGVDLDLEALALDDAASYELLARGTPSGSSSSTADRCGRC